jgi:hypothetical protein
MNQNKSLFIRGLVCLTITLLMSLNCQSQNIEGLLEKHNYSLSLIGNNAVRPGFNIRADFTLKTKEVSRTSNRYLFGPKVERKHVKQIMYAKNFTLYAHFNSHVGLLKNWGISYRKTRTKGWEYQFDLYPLGVQLFAVGKNYKVDPDGTVSKKNMSLSMFYTPGIAASFGKKFKNQNKTLVAWHVRTQINGMSNYNNTWVPSLNLELGLRLKTSNILKNVK